MIKNLFRYGRGFFRSHKTNIFLWAIFYFEINLILRSLPYKSEHLKKYNSHWIQIILSVPAWPVFRSAPAPGPGNRRTPDAAKNSSQTVCCNTDGVHARMPLRPSGSIQRQRVPWRPGMLRRWGEITALVTQNLNNDLSIIIFRS